MIHAVSVETRRGTHTGASGGGSLHARHGKAIAADLAIEEHW